MHSLRDEKSEPSEKSDTEEKEALFEEAQALSRESKISLDTLVKQYSKITEELINSAAYKNVIV